MPIIRQHKWGICGFVSVLNGLREAGKLTKYSGGIQVNLSLEEIQTRIYAEIITYLRYQSFTKSAVGKEIVDITNALSQPPNPQRGSIEEIIAAIEAHVRSTEKEKTTKKQQDLIKTTEVVVAMSPNALVDYLKWVGVKNPVLRTPNQVMNNGSALRKHKNCVVGVGEHAGGNKWNGLEHWMYVDKDGVLFNWGDQIVLSDSMTPDNMQGKDLAWAKYITHVIKIA